MASISAPCPKLSLRSPPAPRPSLPPSLAGSAWIPRLHGSARNCSLVLKAKVQEAVLENSSNSSPVSTTNLEPQTSGATDAKIVEEASSVTDSMISAFMTEVSELVKLVDTRDIVELELKQKDYELVIRKKEALPQPAAGAQVVMMQPPMLPTQTSAPHAVLPSTPTSPPTSATTPTLPPPAKASNSSLPPLKCPMAGTFYHSPAPGEPPFVKVGDKVQKGQVVCIIEAMKLMNEIEADQSGTIIEILAQDAKPVSLDAPLLIIQP